MTMVRWRMRRNLAGEMCRAPSWSRECAVDFIGEEEEVVVAAGGGDDFDFGAGEDLSAGIGGSVEEDGAGAGGDGGVEGVGVERGQSVRLERQRNRTEELL